MRRLDYKRQLIDYFKKNLKKGYDSESLKWALIKQGYTKITVDSALELAKKELEERPKVDNEKPIIKYQIMDENFRPIKVRRPWWVKIFG